MRKLHILMPLGGLGKRFKDQGFELPKPLIEVDGIPMFQKALSSFNSLQVEIETIAVFRRTHEEEFQLGTKLKQARPQMKIVILEELTRGAMETCLFAQKFIPGDDALVVLDCDLFFRSPQYLDYIYEAINAADLLCSGALTYFTSDQPRYSFIKVENDTVLEIAEKKVISSCAVIGSYFFSKSEIFFNCAQEIMKSPPLEASEYYVSAVYKRLLTQNHIFKAAKSLQYNSFGTPEELSTYELQKDSKRQ